jgi:hypothetical protein
MSRPIIKTKRYLVGIDTIVWTSDLPTTSVAVVLEDFEAGQAPFLQAVQDCGETAGDMAAQSLSLPPSFSI